MKLHSQNDNGRIEINCGIRVLWLDRSLCCFCFCRWQLTELSLPITHSFHTAAHEK